MYLIGRGGKRRAICGWFVAGVNASTKDTEGFPPTPFRLVVRRPVLSVNAFVLNAMKTILASGES